jgi:ribonuclease P protein component
MAQPNTLKRRGDFVRLKSGRKWVTPAFVLQAMPRAADDGDGASGPRFGFTVSGRAVAQGRPGGRKRGNAVRRNRARRRLREAVRLVAPTAARADFDYVVIGRAAALERDFDDLLKDLRIAFDKVHSLDQNRERKTPRGRHGQARQNS